MTDFTGALRSPGFYGGGQRARRSIPAGWKGAQWNGGLDRQAVALGAWGI